MKFTDILKMLLPLVLFVVLAGCGSEKKTDAPENETKSETPQKQTSQSYDENEQLKNSNLSDEDKVVLYLEKCIEYMSQEGYADILNNHPADASKNIRDFMFEAGFKDEDELKLAIEKYITSSDKVYELSKKMMSINSKVYKANK